ncbi:leucine-rich repeat domain-containing protein [Hungatella effluvii]|uniref:leucine-rich repeat domain-containing protein n=1 Tax=Hungatella effluvii TaxID=1096246 RepID=UPI002A814455|nr:leucine-rich repeat protein [Hungatella effluvii]
MEVRDQNVAVIKGACGEITDIDISRNTPGMEKFSEIIIDRCAFDGNCTIKCVRLGAGVKRIGMAAFLCSPEITDVQIGPDVEIIEAYAFCKCEKMTELEIGCRVEEIRESAFGECTGIKSIEFGPGLRTIGKGAFEACTGIESIKFGPNLKTIGEFAFDNCVGIKNIEFGPGLKTIGKRAFYNCPEITDLEFGTGLETIESEAFIYCGKLSYLILGPGLKTIGKRAFFRCCITNLVIGRSVQLIGDNAFEDSGAESVALPGGNHNLWGPFNPSAQLIVDIYKENISSSVFKEKYDKNNYKVVSPPIEFERPEDSTVIPGGVRYDLERLGLSESIKVEIYNEDAVAPSFETGYHTGEDAVISYTILPDSLQAVVLSFDPNGKLHHTIPKKINGLPVTAIGDAAVAFREGLETLIIKKEVREIGIMGIYGCPDLKLIYLEHETEKQVPVLYRNAIAQNLQAVVSVKNSRIFAEMRRKGYRGPMLSRKGRIWERGFYSIYMAKGKYGLFLKGNGPMNSCRDFTENSEQASSNAPWSQMSQMIHTIVISGFESVGPYAFRGMENLVEVKLDESIKWISQFAFADCVSLQEIHLPSELEKIYSHAFYNCISLEEIVFPDKLKLIGSHAFFKTSLKEIIIPQSVKTLGTSAFMECRSLTQVFLKTDVPITLGSTQSPVNTVFYNLSEECIIYTKIENFAALADNCNHTVRIVEPEGGTAGEVNWKLDYEGVLEIRGREAGKECVIGDYSNDTAPWSDGGQTVKKVVVCKEITEIGDCAFFCLGIEEVELRGVKRINSQAFARNSGLKKVILPDTLEELAEDSFAFTNEEFNIAYYGTREQMRKIININRVFRTEYILLYKSHDDDPEILNGGARMQQDFLEQVHG